MDDMTAERRATGGGQCAMDLYLRELGGIPLLAAEEERTCARLAAQGDEQARQRLIQGNLRFVIMVARQYRNRSVPFEDLVNEGNIGLIQAAGRFDPDRGVRFVSYAAWYVRRAMLEALGRGLAQGAPSVLSLDGTAGDDEDGEPLWARLADPKALRPEDALAGVAVREQVRSALAGLPRRDARILEDRFGIGGRALPLREAARKHGLSSERVRSIEKRALRRVRASRGAELLMAYAQ